MLKAFVSLQSRISSLRSEDGNAAEYGLIIAGVAVLIIGAVFALGGILSGVFTDIGAQISGAA